MTLLQSPASHPIQAATMQSSSSLPTLTPADLTLTLTLSGALQRSLSLNFAPMAALSPSSASVAPAQVHIATNESQSSDIEQDPESQIPRAISPVPTEIIEDPPVEDILANLKSHGIKIRDFATPGERHNATLKPVTEIFDPYRGIAEFEYYLSTKRVRRPIPGKTLRRLLDLEWVTQEEVEERCAPMDIDALDEYDAKVALDMKEGRGIYPWRALRWPKVPTKKERNAHVLKYMWQFITVDRARKHLEELERREQHLRNQAEEDERLAREFLERRRREEEERTTKAIGALPQDWDSLTLPALFDGTSRKRSLSNAAKEGSNSIRDPQEGKLDAYDGDEEDLGEDAHGSPKRIRLSPELETTATPPRRYGSPYLSPYTSPHTSGLQSQSQFQDPYLHFSPPEKQYPAPLSSYDPKIYPEAASIISSQSQKQSQPRMGDVPTPPGSPRHGSEREDTPPPQEVTSLSRIQRGMKSKLARTQTFTLL